MTLGSLDDISPGYFDDLVFDAAAGQLRLSAAFYVAPMAGDFNGDRRVSGADFIVWQSHYPMASGATLAEGDASSDGKVTGYDFIVWQTNYLPTPAAVPEPQVGLLFLAGLARFYRLGGWRKKPVWAIIQLLL